MEISFLEMLSYLPVVIFGTFVPGPFRAVAVTMWPTLFPDHAGAMTVFGFVQHNFFVLFNAAIGLLFLLGAAGKSAQIPLYVWLPDAMEGPTPVSALIHAATMVTAGVYMVARCTPLFVVSPDAQLVVACTGGFTALLAGLIALTQYDLKRVLALSLIHI